MFAPGIALGHTCRAAGVLPGGLLLRSARRTCPGPSPSPTRSPRNVGTPLGRPAAPDAALRGGRGTAHPLRPARCSSGAGARSPAARSGATWLLYAISRFIIEIYRGDERGMRARDAVHVAVHLGPAAAAQPRDARRGCAAGHGRTPRRLATGHGTCPTACPDADLRPGRRGRPRRRRRLGARRCPRTARGLRLDQVLAVARARALALAGPAADQGRARRWMARARRSTRATAVVSRARRVRRSSVPAPRADAVEPQPLPLDIVYEDSDLVVVDKAGRHGGASRRGPRRRHAGQRAAPPRDGLERHRRRGAARHRAPPRSRHVRAHGGRQERRRASRNCRGSSTIARSRRSTWRWCGAWCDAGRRIERPSAETRGTGRGCRPARAGRATAVTRVMRAETLPGVTLVRVAIATGRTHQIRVHLQRDRPSGGRRRAVRRRAAARAAALRPCCGSSARSCTPHGSCSATRSTAARCEFDCRRCPEDLQSCSTSCATPLGQGRPSAVVSGGRLGDGDHRLERHRSGRACWRRREDVPSADANGFEGACSGWRSIVSGCPTGATCRWKSSGTRRRSCWCPCRIPSTSCWCGSTATRSTQWLWELPAGSLEPGEDAEAAARGSARRRSGCGRTW